MLSNRHTHTQTHRPSTVTLAAHVRRGLINTAVIYWCALNRIDLRDVFLVQVVGVFFGSNDSAYGHFITYGQQRATRKINKLKIYMCMCGSSVQIFCCASLHSSAALLSFQVKGRAHTRFVDSLDVHASTKHV